MEFEGDKPVSEAELHLAQSRQVTLQPLHTDIAPEALPADAVAAAHLDGEVIANVIGDIEQDAPLVQPLAATLGTPPVTATPHKTRTAILTITGLVLLVLVIIFIIFQQ